MTKDSDDLLDGLNKVAVETVRKLVDTGGNLVKTKVSTGGVSTSEQTWLVYHGQDLRYSLSSSITLVDPHGGSRGLCLDVKMQVRVPTTGAFCWWMRDNR